MESTSPVVKMQEGGGGGGSYESEEDDLKRFEGRQKICSMCDVNKPINRFYSNIKSPDGVNDMCRKCQRKGGPLQLPIPIPVPIPMHYKNKECVSDGEDEGGSVLMQQCATCGVSKSISKFYKMMVNDGRDQAMHNCRSCTKLLAKRRKLQSENFSQQQQQLSTKFCKHCEIEKPAPKFYSQRKFKDGLSIYCRRCTKLLKKMNEAQKISSDVFLLPIQAEKNDVESIKPSDWLELIRNYELQHDILDDVDWEVLHLEGCDSGVTSSQHEIAEQCVQNVAKDQHVNQTTSDQNTLKKGVSIQLCAEIGGVFDPNHENKEQVQRGQPKFKRQNSAVQISV